MFFTDKLVGINLLNSSLEKYTRNYLLNMANNSIIIEIW